MDKLDLKNIKLGKRIGEGKESICYDYGDKVVKIFKEKRTSPFKRISNEGLMKLSTLDLKHFNKPIDIIYDNENFVYINSTKKELHDMYYKKNIMTINNFLVGFLMYSAYRHGSKYEIKKTYKATEFINENLGNEYYGDYLENRYKKM